jgi:dihydrofolate synthase/folylpolyglutamate synthase
MDLSFFEITTGMAFRWFADEKVDVAVIEVGLGGRLDSTNIIRPDLSVITSIGLDHCQLLGHTRAAVAGEKAGIIKPGIPALCGEDDAETAPVFEAKAAAEQAPLTFAPRVNPSLWDNRDALLRRMDLRGDYQADNLRTVLAARDILRRDPFYSGLADAAMTEDALIHTAQRAGLRARWEKLASNPDVICDIAHNAPALKRNFAQLEGLLRNGTYDRLLIVYAVMADKDLEAIFPYFPREASWFFATPTTPRALPARQILDRYRAYCAAAGIAAGEACAVDSVAEAVRKALAAADPETLLYIGGSTFAVADALPLFGHIK